MKLFSTLKELVADQKPSALLVDLWGVIHDGETLYPGVKEALLWLKKEHIRVVFLSNAPRRASVAQAGLLRLGIPPEDYTGIVTSGETVYHSLKHARTDSRRNYIYIGPEKDRDLMAQSDYHEVAEAAEAHMAICTGFDHDGSTMAEKMPQLEAALKAGLPMVCANPDMEIVRINGTRALCAGVMAEWYEQQGGTVYYYGKPHRNIYQLAQQSYNLDLSHTLGIGDNLHTDIAGANGVGMGSVLITGGVLKEPLAKGEKLEALIAGHGGHTPAFVLPYFG